MTRGRRDAIESARFTNARLESLNSEPSPTSPTRTRSSARKVTSQANAQSPTKSPRKTTTSQQKVEKPPLTSPLRPPAVTALTPTRTLRSGRSVGDAIVIDDESPVRRVQRAASAQMAQPEVKVQNAQAEDDDSDVAVTRSRRSQPRLSVSMETPPKRPLPSSPLATSRSSLSSAPINTRSTSSYATFC